MLSGEKQDTVTGVWEERERERESANSPRLSALLTDELHVAKCVCVCVCIKCITSSKKNNQRMAEGFRKCLAEYVEYSVRAVPRDMAECLFMACLQALLVTLSLSSQALWEES